jgi:methylglutaconyl-CoA hydratase
LSLDVRRRGAATWITLDRPDALNAMTAELCSALHEELDRIATDRSCRAVVLTGAGRAFSAGQDLKERQGPDVADLGTELRLRYNPIVLAMRRLEKPIIGAVNGVAAGAGISIALACDIVVAAEEATFALTEVRLGMVPAIIAPLLLRRVGPSFCRRYSLTGETFSAAVAQHAGLVHDLVPQDALAKRIDELRNAVLRLAPGAAKATKALLGTLVGLPDRRHRAASIEANVRARLSAEAQEGFRAFLEKRPPAWVRGRS